jgi:ribosomal protein S18 acetylase RimI-like enzyme
MQNQIEFYSASKEDIHSLYEIVTTAMKPISDQINSYKYVDSDYSFFQFKKKFKPCNSTIIKYDNKIAGRLNVVYSGFEIYVSGIHILPEFQGIGIGTKIFEDLIKDSRFTGRAIHLKVHKINSRAISFYTKLGFYVIADLKTKLLMEFI